MKAKVLMFGWEFPPHNSGGLGTACLGLTRAMSQEGVDITFVLPKKVPVSSDFIKIKFAGLEKVNFKTVNSILSPHLTSETYGALRDRVGGDLYGNTLMEEVLRYSELAKDIALNTDHDVIYAHDWLCFGAGMAAKKVSGKPLIVQVHATEFDRCGGENGINRQVYEMEKMGMEEADHIVAVSNLTRNIIIKHYGISPEKVSVVHNGIDESTAPSGGGEGKLLAIKKAGYKIVLFLGRITLQKGPDYFLKTAKKVLEYNPKVMFVMSGSGDMERKMMEEAAKLNIADKVLFTGFLRGKEQHDAYSMADLFVMPSVSEPFGITPLEAMQVGTPVLISRQSGVSEVVKHALKTDFWDVDDMTDKILSVVGHEALKKSLSHNAKREVSGITWKKAAEKVIGIIRKFFHF
jgi:glycosyltransferase involved in cell wall biosynthesis